MSKLAIPYRRYSSDAQTGNSSLERQQQMIDQFLKSPEGEGFTTSPKYDYCDAAVSGFSGSHIEKGDLGRFLKDLEAGKFKRFDSPTLLVENVDRFGRQKATKAISLLTDILDAGVNVYFLSTRQLVTPEMDDTQLLMFVIESTRAHNESKRKSEMVSKAWGFKFDRDEQITALVPFWINPKNKDEVIPDRAALVQRIFDMKYRGISCNKIALTLNEEGIAPPHHERIAEPKRDAQGNEKPTRKYLEKWTGAKISQTICNRAVLGELAEQSHTTSNSVRVQKFDESGQAMFQTDGRDKGKPLLVWRLKEGRTLRPARPDYFPALVNAVVFNACNLDEHKLGKRRVATVPNSVKLFRNILRCSGCGGKVEVYGSREKYAGTYKCGSANVKACHEQSISRKEVDSAIITRLLPNLNNLNVNDSLEIEIAEAENRLDVMMSAGSKMVRQLVLFDAGSDAEKEISQMIRDNNKATADLRTHIEAIKSKRRSSDFENVDHLDLSTFEGRIEAQVILVKMFKRIILNTEKRTCDFVLQDGSTITDFNIDGHHDSREILKYMNGDTEPKHGSYYIKPQTVNLEEVYQQHDDEFSNLKGL
jgi:DNA invertase Pin-like site-specific DNA recombinase